MNTARLPEGVQGDEFKRRKCRSIENEPVKQTQL
jgi:hypothetical protein